MAAGGERSESSSSAGLGNGFGERDAMAAGEMVDPRAPSPMDGDGGCAHCGRAVDREQPAMPAMIHPQSLPIPLPGSLALFCHPSPSSDTTTGQHHDQPNMLRPQPGPPGLRTDSPLQPSNPWVFLLRRTLIAPPLLAFRVGQPLHPFVRFPFSS